jgi:hypothetical protein
VFETGRPDKFVKIRQNEAHNIFEIIHNFFPWKKAAKNLSHFCNFQKNPKLTNAQKAKIFAQSGQP